ncbi:hypothetical protein AB0F52_31775 [Amycolatopsis sp. NPDC024027]|uniref:hypothetical protein n=1 Tax=Amycolatopsis sp. NPDC024027 TaxID=3154327 RepID=UPI0033E0F05F
MRTLRTVVALSAALALGGCGLPRAVSGSPAQAPASTATVTAPVIPTVTAPVPQTVFVPPPQTVYVAPKGVAATSQWYAQPSWIDAQPWITITPAAGQTPCQWLNARGYPYAQAYAAWAQNGFPASWSATGDGYPCQKSYGPQH